MGPLIMVSRFPLYMAVTVALKAEPATTVEGAVISRIAWEEPQLKDTRANSAAIKVQSRRVATFCSPRWSYLPENLLLLTRPAFELDTLSSPNYPRGGTAIGRNLQSDSAYDTA